MKRKAEMGIGTLIIFIAMILVAAIAAGVLIQTATTLQNKALLTGERSKSQVSTSIRPMLVYAQDGSTNNNVTNFTIKMKLAPGSDPVRFSDLLVEFSLKNQSVDYKYVTNSSDDNTSYENGTMNTTHYYVKYLIQGDNFNWGYLQRGDVVAISLKTPRAVGEDETVSITLVPKIGNPTTIETATPDIITNRRVTIFP